MSLGSYVGCMLNVVCLCSLIESSFLLVLYVMSFFRMVDRGCSCCCLCVVCFCSTVRQSSLLISGCRLLINSQDSYDFKLYSSISTILNNYHHDIIHMFKHKTTRNKQHAHYSCHRPEITDGGENNPINILLLPSLQLLLSSY